MRTLHGTVNRTKLGGVDRYILVFAIDTSHFG